MEGRDDWKKEWRDGDKEFTNPKQGPKYEMVMEVFK